MRQLPPSRSSTGYTPNRLQPLAVAPVLDQGQRLTDIQAIQRLFANGENGGYWPADSAYLYEDSAGTIPASLNGVVGLQMDQSRGGVAQARRNLLTYSEDFYNAAWSKSKVTVVQNAAIAPDGTLTADKLIDDTQTGEHYIEQTVSTASNQSYAYTLYVKPGETTGFHLVIVSVGASATTSEATFSVTNGVIAFVSNTLGIINSVTITPDREGFYKITIIYTLNGTVTSHRFRINAKQVASYTGDGSSGIYLWGAQLELGASATPYQKIITGTADLLPGNHAFQQTTANKPYLRRTPVSNKFWLDSNTATGALTATFASAIDNLYTPAMGRRNIFNYTQSFFQSLSSWTLNSCAAIDSSEVYQGIGGVKKFYPTSTGTDRYWYGIPNVGILPSSSVYTISVVAKAAGINCLALYIRNSSIKGTVYYDLSDGSVQIVEGSVTTLTATIQDMGNGWYYLTATTSAPLTSSDVSEGGSGYILCNAKGSFSVTANGTNGIYIVNPQLEAGAVATTYQPILAGGHTTSIATVGADGVTIAENQTVGTTYNLTPYNASQLTRYRGDTLIINRGLTLTEKALINRHFQRGVPTISNGTII